ncbi:CHAT domain-containing protein [Trichoderma ceciliae]
MVDLNSTVQRDREPPDAAPEAHPDPATRRLQSRENEYRIGHQVTSSSEDLDASIQRLQEAIDAMPEDDPDRAGRLQRLSFEYHDRYRITNATADLNMAIQKFHEAFEKTVGQPQPQRIHQLENLAHLYKIRYDRTGFVRDLDQCIQLRQELLNTIPEDHADLAYHLGTLSEAYESKCIKTGNIAYLEKSIQLSQEALHKTPEDHPERHLQLILLASSFRLRFDRMEHLSDLDRSIQLDQEALDKIPEYDPFWLQQISTLGNSYIARFERTKAIADLNQHLQFLQGTLDKLPENHPGRASLLEDVGNIYRTRYHITEATADLKQCIQFCHKSLNETPKDHKDRVHRLQNIASAYRNSYTTTGAIADFEQSIQFCHEALSETPEDHPDRPFRLRSLADTYILEKTRATSCLDQAIKFYTEALGIIQEGHVEKAYQLLSLSFAYRSRYTNSRSLADLQQSIRLLQKVLDFDASPMRIRFLAGRDLLGLHARVRNWSQAHQAASQTLSLLPFLTPRFLDTSDKQQLLNEIAGLGSNAAAVALMAGKTPYEAIRLLELGRGIIATSLSDMRMDTSELDENYPEIAKEFNELRNQLDLPQQDIQRYDAAKKLEQTIDVIRGLPGFERFLLAPSEDELIAAAVSGPIVVVNVSVYRCDALIIEKRGLGTLRLPDLHSSEIQARIGTLSKQELLPDLLEWLWNTIARPVLEALGFTEPPESDWPRMWWVPTGPLTKLPLHAAGHHTDGSFDTVLDRVISSYSSSARTVVQSHQRHLRVKAAPESDKAVLVGMGQTLGHGDLRFAPQEIEDLASLCNAMLLQVNKPRPCRQDVLSALQDCKVFHFAGHGLTDELDPSNSSLLLSDGPLTVGSLFETNLYSRAPFLAYLSACGTGQVKHDSLIDEALHLISACQLAGFRHVIGTLWEVNDESCVKAATTTYQWMKRRDMCDGSVAEGLHRAIRHLRCQWMSDSAARVSKRMAAVRAEDGPKEAEQTHSGQAAMRDPRTAELYEDPPLNWVPYVHFGI